jgi:hypothetical protein
VGNIHTKVTDGLLAEVFSSAGPLEGCKLIRKEKVNWPAEVLSKELANCCAFYFACTSM